MIYLMTYLMTYLVTYLVTYLMTHLMTHLMTYHDIPDSGGDAVHVISDEEVRNEAA